MKALIEIQSALKAPKNQRNNFGKYSYRSCEDILEALKPLLKEHDAYINLSDKLVMVGDRYYVEATATIHCNGEEVSGVAYAREDEEKKGMAESQVTGSASSYARKYALNGLFGIDDAKDADTQDNREKPKAKPDIIATAEQHANIKALSVKASLSEEQVLANVKASFKKDSLDALTKAEAAKLIGRITDKIEKSSKA